MAQQTRVVQRIFGETGASNDFAQIGSAAAGTPLLTKDPTVMQQLAQYSEGLLGTSINQGDTILPRLEDFNSLLFLVTTQLAYILQNGIPEWINSVDQRYYANVSFVTVGGDVYQAILGDDSTNINAQRNPTTEPTWWRLIRTPEERGSLVGDFIIRGGNVVALSAANPRFCLTNFEGSASVDVANVPDYVPWLRAQQAIYLEGQTGETSQFSGTVAGSVFTLDDNTANNALFAALVEDQAAFGTFTGWRTFDIDGTTFAMTALTAPRSITVTGSPSTGTQNAIFYPHRIAGSTTTARVHSLRGRVLVGAGTGEVISGFMRRDRMQQITGSIQLKNAISDSTLRGNAQGALSDSANTGASSTSVQASGSVTANTISLDSANSPGARTGSDTHGPDYGAHIYQYVGRVL